MVWGTAAAAAPVAWADDEVDQNEALPPKAPPADNPDFPTLGEAIKQAPKAKKKGKTIPLGEFMAGAPAKMFGPRQSDKDIISQLPKAPRGGDREEGDDGGAFKTFGGDRGGFGRRDGEERPERRNRDDDFQASRADETRDWGATRTFTPSEGARGGGGGGFGGAGGERRAGGGFSSDRPAGASDGVDDWGSSRKFEPSAERPGGFRDGPRSDRDEPRRDGPRREYEPSRAEEGDGQWSKNFQPSDPAAAGRPSGSRGFGFSDRPSAPADEEDRWARRGPAQDAVAPAAAAAPAGERPRLKLQPRTKPVEALVADVDSQAGDSEQPKKSNPFGAARPREEVLKEKGVDVKEQEEPVEAIVRDESAEEKAVKDEIEQLRKRLEVVKASGPDPESIADEIASAAEDVDTKVQELAKLKVETDQKVRLARKALADASAAAAKEEGEEGGDKFQEARSAAGGKEREVKETRPAADPKSREIKERDPKDREPRERDANDRAPPAARARGRDAAPVAAGAPGRERW